MNKKGFTLLEALTVIIVIGVLAVVAFTLYTNSAEKARAGEGKILLARIRNAEILYYERFDNYTDVETNLAVEDNLWGACSDKVLYFKFLVTGATTNDFTLTAERCTTANGGGKPPARPSSKAYTLYLYANGTYYCTGTCP